MDSNLAEVLEHIDPARLTYQEWCNVGMALKHEGYSCDVWDAWSRNDSRYHTGECQRKWETFHGSTSPVTGGTIVQMAKDQGWFMPTVGEGYELDWESIISPSPAGVLYTDPAWLEGKELHEPAKWEPAKQIITYLETLFESTECVGFVTEVYEKEGKFMPSKGAYTKTAGELIQELNKCGDDIGGVIGDYNPKAGAWIRFNPLDGKGVKNENVTDYRYALVESDKMDLEKQNAIVRELELPVACLVHSGKKSIHAIVRIDADTYEEYRKRVDFLYTILRKNGMDVDTQNKNPSRLSRLPGIMRDGHKQYLIDTNIGKASFAEWKEWIESLNDDLPDPDNLASQWENMPALAPPLIHNVLRQGHKMLVAGPSKAGKSYALIELCCSIAEGMPWMGFPCAKGKVLYVNLELDRASCLHRFRDIYTVLSWEPRNIGNIDIWNLRGKSVPMDKLAPKLIRRAMKKNYIAIVIDPIYKVITGDENSADQMAAFCNQFDKVCTELGAAVIYCHHHSKGAQGGKRSMDRASGSGVFARDPDALLDFIELELNDHIVHQKANELVARACVGALHKEFGDCRAQELYSQDDACSGHRMTEICQTKLCPSSFANLTADIDSAWNQAKARSAWRIEGTLREFPKFLPINVWFEYPVHVVDQSEVLKDLESESNPQIRKRGNLSKSGKRAGTSESRLADRKKALDTAYGACSVDGNVTVTGLAEFMGVCDRTVRDRIKEHGGYWLDGNAVGRK